MKQRFSVKQHAPKSYRALIEFDKCVNETGFEAPLLYLIYVRISQNQWLCLLHGFALEGCAKCWSARREDGARCLLA